MEGNRLDQLMPDGVCGVQGCHGILKDDGDLISTDRLHDLFTGIHQLLAVQLDGPVHNFAGAGKNLHNRIGRNALSGAGFSHNSKHFSPVKVKGYTIYRTDFSRRSKERGMKVVNFQ